jgi:hypothetical protein
VSTGATASSSRSTVAKYARWHADGATGCQTAVGADTLMGWPLSARLPLGALPTAVPRARWYAQVILREWGLPAWRTRPS